MVILRWLNRLIKPNSGLSSKSFFLVSITIIGCLLLIVPAVILLVEVWYNHTITTDLSGMAEYIGAVAAIFATAGVTKAWSEKFEVRNEVPIEMQEKQKTEGETATNE